MNRERKMKQFLTLLAILLAFTVVNGRADSPVPQPTPPVISAVKDTPATDGQTLVMVCPGQITLAPASMPAGWQSVTSAPRYVYKISIDKSKHTAVCWYGVPGDTNFFLSILITRSFPADYECQTEPNFLYARCNRRQARSKLIGK